MSESFYIKPHFFCAAVVAFLFPVQAGAQSTDGRFWYHESGERWTFGKLLEIGDGYMCIETADGAEESFLLTGRSTVDQLAITSLRTLDRAASRFRESPFPFADKELARVSKLMQTRGASQAWANASIGKMSSQHTDQKAAWNAVVSGFNGTDSRFRWILLNGLEYQIASVEIASNACGLSRILVEDHDGRYRAVLHESGRQLFFLPRFWDQPTFRASDTTTQGAPWNFRRGPSLTRLASTGEHLVSTNALTVDGPSQVWTDPSSARAYEHLATSYDAWNQSERLVRPFHRRRHEITGDLLCRQRSYIAAIEEYSSAITYDDKMSMNYLRRGFAYVGAKRYELAEEDFNRAVTLANGDRLIVSATRELLARLTSRNATVETDDLRAKSLHEAAAKVAASIPYPDFRRQSEALAKPVRDWCLANPDFDINRKARSDMKQRADRWLRGAIDAYAGKQYSVSIASANRAIELSLEQSSVVAPALDLLARSTSAKAAGEVNAELAADLFGKSFSFAVNAGVVLPKYWESRDVDLEVRTSLASWRGDNNVPLVDLLRRRAQSDFIRRTDAARESILKRIDSIRVQYEHYSEVCSTWNERKQFESALSICGSSEDQLRTLDSMLAEADMLLTKSDSFVPAGETSAASQAMRTALANCSTTRRNAFNELQLTFAVVEQKTAGYLSRIDEFSMAVELSANATLRLARVSAARQRSSNSP